ncbi:potassium-transporting ATPase subunit KdpC [Desulfolutivibrio sulfoxidireducens]|uniref:potassium-transporting ATPase subunit KdpC n=1 Tax=Desulfolutivibrio sulfoxidireducens TaxID=2773299 RepID=UPI00159CFC41|nr:potassium-transporting ATPase subunit KdpC [Desulfolutivibrio sulfoxidireducens]QLA17254.1 potassium-transporting ATPase subunit KdpC [Desulfolutivibrio sulfoxidireducens]
MDTAKWREPLSALLLLLVLTGLTGLAYPLGMTLLARTVFPDQAGGSLMLKNGEIVGSALVGQSFASPGYFHGRPSATSARPYDAAASSGSNLAPSNPALAAAVADRIAALRDAYGPDAAIPVDMVTASGSGLDPHVTPAGAHLQVPAVARARGLPEDVVRGLVDSRVEGRLWGFWGEARVNVLALNLALDDLGKASASPSPLDDAAGTR